MAKKNLQKKNTKNEYCSLQFPDVFISYGHYFGLSNFSFQPDIIRSHGYPAETHTVQSSDGYLLTIHRIPSQSYLKKPVVFLLHGFVCSSADWVLLGPKKALGFILADGGFDVWMGNSRGNKYSRSHIRLNPKKRQFWNFS